MRWPPTGRAGPRAPRGPPPHLRLPRPAARRGRRPSRSRRPRSPGRPNSLAIAERLHVGPGEGRHAHDPGDQAPRGARGVDRLQRLAERKVGAPAPSRDGSGRRRPRSPPPGAPRNARSVGPSRRGPRAPRIPSPRVRSPHRARAATSRSSTIAPAACTRAPSAAIERRTPTLRASPANARSMSTTCRNEAPASRHARAAATGSPSYASSATGPSADNRASRPPATSIAGITSNVTHEPYRPAPPGQPLSGVIADARRTHAEQRVQLAEQRAASGRRGRSRPRPA